MFTYEFSYSVISVIHKSQYTPGFEPTANDLKVFPVTDIDKILFRKKGNKGIATAVGIVSGMAIGAISGFISGGSYLEVGDSDMYVSGGTKAVFRGMFGALIGFGAGIIIGSSVKSRFVINGDAGKYREMYPKLEKYSIVPGWK